MGGILNELIKQRDTSAKNGTQNESYQRILLKEREEQEFKNNKHSKVMKTEYQEQNQRYDFTGFE